MIQEQAVRELGTRREDPAYRSGWQDGRFGPTQWFGSNPKLAGRAGHRARPASYHGHRGGRGAPTQQLGSGPQVAGWAGHRGRLAYYQGHRDGRRVREMLAEERTA